MNSFFASVEQQANPFLRGKPLGVSNSRVDGACLIGTSKEAKALGIKNGIPLYKARKIYPKIQVVAAEPEKYREVSRNINKIFKDYTQFVEPYSVDESFLKLPDKNPLLVGAEIKKRIRQEVGEWLTCSVGIAPNKFMAKLAADLQKPDGLSVIWRSQLRTIYKTKKFTDLWGINWGWTRRLEKLGIISPDQLLDYPVENLIAMFGKPGFYIWQRVNGLEEDDQAVHNSYRTAENPKSFGHSWVLNFRTTDKERLKPVILRLAEKAARRMRSEGFKAQGIYISIRDVAGNYFHKSKKLKQSINTGQQLYYEALHLWKSWQFTFEIMHIAVGFTHLLVDCLQLDLFGDRNPKLIAALDAINNRYGEFTIRSGILTNTQTFAPDAIAFGR